MAMSQALHYVDNYGIARLVVREEASPSETAKVSQDSVAAAVASELALRMRNLEQHFFADSVRRRPQFGTSDSALSADFISGSVAVKTEDVRGRKTKVGSLEQLDRKTKFGSVDPKTKFGSLESRASTAAGSEDLPGHKTKFGTQESCASTAASSGEDFRAHKSKVGTQDSKTKFGTQDSKTKFGSLESCATIASGGEELRAHKSKFGTQESCASTASGGEEDHSDEPTIMLKNIACRYREHDVAAILDEAGLQGAYSSIYVPFGRCRKRNSNLGYAFVTLKTEFHVERCEALFAGKVFGDNNSSKVCEVTAAYRQMPINGQEEEAGGDVDTAGIHSTPENMKVDTGDRAATSGVSSTEEQFVATVLHGSEIEFLWE